jgi:hypothetical protein
MPSNRRPSIRSVTSILALLLVVWLGRQAGFDLGLPDGLGVGGPARESDGYAAESTPSSAPSRPASSAKASAPARAADDVGAQRIAQAFAARESGFMVTLAATVEKVLPDDRDGSRHQRFLVRLPFGPRLLVAHNIDLAERVPVAPGVRLRLRGQYEWTDRGGVLHWTHRDPDGNHPGGWIDVEGRRVE